MPEQNGQNPEQVQDPFARFTPEQRVDIQTQIRQAIASGRLNDAQKRSATNALKMSVQAAGNQALTAQKRDSASRGVATINDFDWDKMSGMVPAFERTVKGAAEFPFQAVARPIDTLVTPTVEAYKKSSEAAKEANQALKIGRVGDFVNRSVESMGQGAAMLPLVGAFAQHLADRVEKGDITGAATELVTAHALGKFGDEGWKVLKPKAIEILRKSGTKEAGRLLGTAEGGQGVSQQGIIARSTERVAREAQKQIETLVDDAKKHAQALDAQGKTTDVSRIASEIVTPEMQRLARSVNMEGQVADLLTAFKRVAQDPNAVIGPSMRLHRMTAGEILDVTHNLGDTIYDKPGSKSYRDYASRMRAELSKGLEDIDPALAAKQKRISELIQARDRAAELSKSALEKTKTSLFHWMRATVPEAVFGVGAMYALRELGMHDWYSGMAVMSGLHILWKNTPTTLMRAAIEQRLGDFLEGRSTIVRPGGYRPAMPLPPPGMPNHPIQGPNTPKYTPPDQGNNPPAAGGTPFTGRPGVPPTTPTPAPSPAATAPQGGAANMLPTTPPSSVPAAAAPSSSVVGATEVALEHASDKVKAMVGALRKEFPDIPTTKLQEMAEARVKAAETTGKPVRKPSAKETTSTPKTTEEQVAELQRMVAAASGGGEATGVAAAPAKESPAAPAVERVTRVIDGKEVQVTKVPEGVSGVSERGKATFEAIDKTATTDSALAKAQAKKAAERDVKALSELAKVDLTQAQKDKIVAELEKRQGARERKQAQRERDAATAGPGARTAVEGDVQSGTAKTAVVSGDASPEQLMIATEGLYNEINKLAGGAEYVKQLKQFAKQAKMPAIMEFQQAHEAWETLKQLEEQPGPGAANVSGPEFAASRGIRAITDPNINNYRPAIGLARAIEQDGAAGAKQFVQRQLGKDVTDWRSAKLGDNTAGQLFDDLSSLIKEIDDAKPTNVGTIFRGVERIPRYESLKPGNTLSLPLSSFAKDPSVARIHLSPRGDGFILRLTGEAKVVDAADISHLPAETEIFTRGKFKVTKVSGDSRVTIIDIQSLP